MDPRKTASADLAENLLKSEESGKRDIAIDEALNRKDFAEFVALHKDADSIIEGGPRAAEVIKAFEKKGKLIETARKVLQEQISREIGKEDGLELSNEDLAAVDQHLSKMAVEDTEGFLKLAEKADTFRTQTAETKVLEDRLRALGMDVNQGIEANAAGLTKESLQEKKYVLGSVKNTDYASRALQTMASWMGSSTRNEVVGANRDAAQEKYGLETNWYGKIKDLDKQIEMTEGLIKLQDVRKEMVGEIFPTTLLGPIVQAKVAKYVGEISLSDKLEELEKAQAFLERARLASEKGETGLDYLGALNEGDAQAQIDKGLTSAIVTRVDEAINKSTLGNNALSRLEKSLSDFMKKEKLGSKDKDGYRDFLVKTLEEQAGLLAAAGRGPEEKAKAVLIKRVIIKINNA